MPFSDSISKIVTSYFACVCSEEFTYQNRVFKPKRLTVTPYLFRGYTCPAKCGGCCPVFTLDYLPEPLETHPYPLKKRFIHFNGRRIPIYSDLNQDCPDRFCKNLDMNTGRCNIHKHNPFSCDFELTRFLHFSKEESPNRLTTKLYGRGHAFMRVDGKRGALCEMTPPNDESVASIVRKLKRLEQWCNHFHLKNKLGNIISYAEKGPRLDYITV